MEQQNDLLLKILRKVDNANEFEMSPKITEIKNPESNTRKEENLNTKPNNTYEHLSELEKKRADEFISHGIREGQVLAINKTTREIDRFDQNEWKKMVSKAEDVDWMIIVQK